MTKKHCTDWGMSLFHKHLYNFKDLKHLFE